MSWWSFSKANEDSAKLPSFPNTPAGDKMNNEMVKSAVSDVSQTNLNIEEIPSLNSQPQSSENKKQFSIKESEPFFVRIDKFNEAKKNLVEISKKIETMESILDKLTETKAKEDAEISSWKQEITKIRSYVSEIDDSIFNKI